MQPSIQNWDSSTGAYSRAHSCEQKLREITGGRADSNMDSNDQGETLLEEYYAAKIRLEKQSEEVVLEPLMMLV